MKNRKKVERKEKGENDQELLNITEYNEISGNVFVFN